NRFQKGGRVGWRRPRLLDDEHGRLGCTIGDGECSGVPDARRCRARGCLELLRIDVLAADDHHVLDASREMQVTVQREAEVAGSQERTLSAEKACAEDACGLRRISPVTRTG